MDADFSNANSERIDNYPSISEMLEQGIEIAARIKRNTKDSLQAWLDRARFLYIARDHHGLVGADYKQFHTRLGIDTATASWLPKLHPFEDRVLAHYGELADASAIKSRVPGPDGCSADKFQWPGAKAALAQMQKLYEPDKPKKEKTKPDQTALEESARKAIEQPLQEALADKNEALEQLRQSRERLAEMKAENDSLCQLYDIIGQAIRGAFIDWFGTYNSKFDAWDTSRVDCDPGVIWLTFEENVVGVISLRLDGTVTIEVIGEYGWFEEKGIEVGHYHTICSIADIGDGLDKVIPEADKAIWAALAAKPADDSQSAPEPIQPAPKAPRKRASKVKVPRGRDFADIS